jgi:hypothetical protein
MNIVPQTEQNAYKYKSISIYIAQKDYIKVKNFEN